MADTKLDLQINVKGAGKSSSQIEKVKGSLGKLSKVSRKAKVALVSIAVAGGALITKLGGLAGEFEQTQVAFTTMLGSGERAQVLLDDIAQFAASTPFELPGIQGAAKSLLGFGTNAEEIIPTLRMLGDVGAGLNIPLGELSEIYGKARTSGVLFAEDVNQLTGRGIPIIKELAKQFGIAESEVKGLVSSGAVGFENLEEAFISMTEEGGQFSGLMEAQSQTLLGQWSNLKDSLTQLGIAIGTSLLPVLKPLVSGIGAMANNIKLFAQENPQVAKLVGILLLATTAIAALLVPIASLGVILPGIAAGWALVSASMLPITAVIAAIVAAVVAIKWAWENNFLGIQEKTKIFVNIALFYFELLKQSVTVIFNDLKDFIQLIMQSEFIEYIQTSLGILSEIWSARWEGIKFVFTSVWGAIKNTVSTVWNIIQDVVIGGMALLNGDWSTAWEAVKSIIDTVWSAIVESIQGYVDTILGIIDVFVGAIKTAIDWLKKLIKKGEDAPSGLGSSVSGARAIGGGVMPGNSFLVGERGPEIFTPSGTGSITPTHKMGGSITVNITGTFLSDDAAEKMAEMTIKQLKQSNAIG